MIFFENIFSNKIWNVHSIWFPHRFWISWQKVTLLGLADMPDPQGSLFQAQLIAACKFWIFSFFLRIFMHICKGWGGLNWKNKHSRGLKNSLMDMYNDTNAIIIRLYGYLSNLSICWGEPVRNFCHATLVGRQGNANQNQLNLPWRTMQDTCRSLCYHGWVCSRYFDWSFHHAVCPCSNDIVRFLRH